MDVKKVGEVYNALKEYNFLENTFIIWTSDHGDGQCPKLPLATDNLLENTDGVPRTSH